MLKIWFIKYVIGACTRGSCHECPYMWQCFDNFTPVTWKELFQRFWYMRFKRNHK